MNGTSLSPVPLTPVPNGSAFPMSAIAPNIPVPGAVENL